MIWNPKEVLRTEALRGEEGYPIKDKQIQQAGIDLRLKKIFTVNTNIITITENEKPDFNSIYQEIQPDPLGLIKLEPGCAYSVDTMESIKVPNNMSAFVLHRSTFNRAGVFITGSVYDPGFVGNVGVTMYVHNHIQIEIGVRIAQILFIETSAASSYKGSYQKLQSHA